MSRATHPKPARNAAAQPLALPAHITLDWWRAKCDEEGECWLWRGVYSNGHPVVFMSAPRRYITARRVAAQLAGRLAAPGQPVATTCGCRECVRPEHMRPSSTRAIAQQAAKNGAWRGAARAARISAAKRAQSPITTEMATAIRLAPRGQLRPTAERLGVKLSTAKAIRTNRIHRDRSSPWAGMGGRAP